MTLNIMEVQILEVKYLSFKKHESIPVVTSFFTHMYFIIFFLLQTLKTKQHLVSKGHDELRSVSPVGENKTAVFVWADNF